MRKPLSFFIALIAFLWLFSEKAFAFCPVCTAVVCAGYGLSRWLGVDDTVSGVWIGAAILSSAFWFSNYLESKKISFPLRTVSLAFFSYIVVLAPMWAKGLIHPENCLFGINKLILGVAVGSAVFLGGLLLDKVLRRRNNGKVFFYYQKVAIPVALLSIGSAVFYFLTK